MKTDFVLLDSTIIEALVKRPMRLDELFAAVAVRNQALRLNIRRAGVSPSGSQGLITFPWYASPAGRPC